MKNAHFIDPAFLKSSSTPTEESKASTLATINDPSISSSTETCYSQESLIHLKLRKNEPFQVYSRSIELNPNSFKARIRLGILLRRQGNVEEAIKSFRQATKIDPTHVDGYLNLGIALYCKRSLEEAVEAFNTAIKLSPNNFDAYNNLGLALRKQGKFEPSVRAFNKAISINPERSTAYNNLGIVLRNQGKLDEAINAYNMAIKFSPNDAEAYNNLGLAFRNQGKLKKAIEAYNKAIESNPKHAGAYNNLGSALYKKGKLEKALNAYNMAIYLDQQFILCYCNRAKIWNNMGKEDKALEDFNKAYELMKDEKLQRNLSGKNKSYVKQMIEEEREDLLNKVTRLHRLTIDTENIINHIGPEKEIVKEEVGKFRELRKTIVKVTEQIVDTIQKKPQEGNNSSSEEVAQLSLEVKKLQEMNLQLMQQLQEHTKKLEEQGKMLKKHENALKVGGVYDKTEIIQGFKDLAVDDPELYKYCKTFYWTLINYFAAYRALGTSLIQGNVYAGITNKDLLIELGMKKIITVLKDLSLGVPFVGGAISLIDGIIDDIFVATRRIKFNNKINIINKIIAFNNDPKIVLEESLSLLCAKVALSAVQAKKDKILSLYTATASEQEFADAVYQYVKAKSAELKEMILPTLRLYDGPATQMAVYDVTLLLAYISVTHQEVIDSKVSLDEQFREIVVKEKWKELKLQCPLEDPLAGKILTESTFLRLPAAPDSNRCNIF